MEQYSTKAHPSNVYWDTGPKKWSEATSLTSFTPSAFLIHFRFSLSCYRLRVLVHDQRDALSTVMARGAPLKEYTNLPDDPSLAGIVVNFHDITESKRAKEALQKVRRSSNGLREARYWGLAKLAIKFSRTVITCNLKRMVELLFQRRCSGRSPLGSFHQGITVPGSG